MNENIDLTKILKDCPMGTKLYCSIYGEVEFVCIDEYEEYPIKVMVNRKFIDAFNRKGFIRPQYNIKCNLFPSKDQRDWNKFKAPCRKTGHFDPKTLQPFDRVLVRHSYAWRCELLSHYREHKGKIDFYCTSAGFVYSYCIPYNEDTKHLVDTTYEAPEYYRYWE